MYKQQQKTRIEEMIRRRIVELNMESSKSLHEGEDLFKSDVEYGPSEREEFEFFRAEKN